MHNVSHRGGLLDWCGAGLGDPWGLLDAAPDCPCTEKRLHVLYQMYYQYLTTILILTWVCNRAGSTAGNNGGGGAKPYAAPRLCMYWNISAILWSAARRASRSAIILASISWHSLLSSSSWICNITSQRYSNSKRRYITQGMTSYRSTNLELLYAMLWVVVPRSYD